MRKHPVLSFAILAIVPTWALQFLFLALGWDLFGAKVAELFILLGAATLVTARISGRDGVRRLYAGVVRWRMGFGRFALVLLAMPILTLIVAAAGGALRSPELGVGQDVLMYLFITLIFGALLGNVWEETAWTGFAQARQMDRRGLLRGSLLTAIPFALIHLPLAWETGGLHGTSGRDLAITWAVLIVSTPVMRYLLGAVFLDTGGSILAAGILHASVNASGQLGFADSWWPGTVAMAVLAVLVGVTRQRRRTGAGGQARLDDRGYASAGSVSTLTR